MLHSELFDGLSIPADILWTLCAEGRRDAAAKGRQKYTAKYVWKGADLKEILTSDMYILPLLVNLVGLGHMLVEDLQG